MDILVYTPAAPDWLGTLSQRSMTLWMNCTINYNIVLVVITTASDHAYNNIDFSMRIYHTVMVQVCNYFIRRL